MYVPPLFNVPERERLYAFIETYGFATLISAGDTPFVSHVPLLLNRETQTLEGHFARANPHGTLFDGTRTAVAVFHGPHAYVSPAWYAPGKPAVPTWNYAVVHVEGAPRLREDPAWTRNLLARTVAKYESARSNPWPYDLPAEFNDAMLQQIVAFEFPIRSIQGKFKLGQNRSKTDRSGVLVGLESEGGAAGRELAEFTRRSLQASE